MRKMRNKENRRGTIWKEGNDKQERKEGWKEGKIEGKKEGQMD